jgi:hypothetical protein
MFDTTTRWEKMDASASTAKYLCSGAYTLWSRLMNGEQFFTVLPRDAEPINGLTFGHHSIADALKAERLMFEDSEDTEDVL